MPIITLNIYFYDNNKACSKRKIKKKLQIRVKFGIWLSKSKLVNYLPKLKEIKEVCVNNLYFY